MSGPKIIRIVTRAEHEAACRDSLASVTATMKQVIDIAQQQSVDADSLKVDFGERVQTMRDMIQQQRWSEMQRHARSTIEFLNAEATKITEKAQAVAAAQRMRGYRLASAARTIRRMLEARALGTSPELQEISRHAAAASSDELAHMEEVLNNHIARLKGASGPAQVDESAARLAKTLAAGVEAESFSVWATRNIGKLDPRVERMSEALAEIQALAGPEEASVFHTRVEAIETEHSEHHRSLLLDSLMLDLSDRCRIIRTNRNTIASLEVLIARLLALKSAEAEDLAAKIRVAIGEKRLQVAERFSKAAEALINDERAVLAARSRREALLSGLSELGYEVREGMETAWVSQGRLVIKKPTATDYAVELSAPPDASRIQVRLVGSNRPSSQRTSMRDKDAETIWCTEFQQLEALVAERAGTIKIERAIESGAETMKSVDLIVEMERDSASQSGRKRGL